MYIPIMDINPTGKRVIKYKLIPDEIILWLINFIEKGDKYMIRKVLFISLILVIAIVASGCSSTTTTNTTTNPAPVQANNTTIINNPAPVQANNTTIINNPAPVQANNTT
jgi:uncharacterized protein YceK